MHRIRVAVTAFLFLCFAAFAYSQEPEQPKEPRQEEPRRDEAAPPRQDEARPPKPQDEATPPRRQDEEKPSKPEKRDEEKARKEEKQGRDEHGQEAHGQADYRGHARPAGKRAHIPDPQFRAHFGQQHRFTVKRVITQTTIVPGQTQFVYSGYTFVILDPWPSEWLFTDDCYIDYVDDDYFLFDVFHPGLRIALFVAG
jgi:hypothetical protein